MRSDDTQSHRCPHDKKSQRAAKASGIRASAASMLLTALLLVGCSAVPPPSANGTTPTDTSTTAPPSEQAPEATAPPVVAEVEPPAESCDWESPRLSASANAPSGQDGELAQALVGAWQHTHTDGGSGFEAVDNDHRFIFPSSTRLLYCQHVPGATDHAERAADVVLNGTVIELPGGQVTYTLTAWSADALLWTSSVGGYVYLLQRR